MDNNNEFEDLFKDLDAFLRGDYNKPPKVVEPGTPNPKKLPPVYKRTPVLKETDVQQLNDGSSFANEILDSLKDRLGATKLKWYELLEPFLNRNEFSSAFIEINDRLDTILVTRKEIPELISNNSTLDDSNKAKVGMLILMKRIRLALSFGIASENDARLFLQDSDLIVKKYWPELLED